MEITFSLEEEDLRALVEHQIRQSPIIPRRIRRRRMLYVTAFAALALGAFLLQDRPLAYAFAIIAALFLFLYGALVRRRLRSSIPRLIRERMTPSSLGEKRLRVLPNALEAISPHTQSKVIWRLVGPVETNESHLFIPIDGIYSVVIPISKVTSGDLGRFVANFVEYRKAAA